MKLLEVFLNDSITINKESIQKYLDKEVIINDFHRGWFHGSLILNGETDYVILEAETRERRFFCYHDLKTFLVVIPSKK